MSYITLTTDFGASPGVMKGVIWCIVPSVQIADLPHTIRPQDVRQAALTLARQVYYVSENTIHVAVVDPGVGTARRPIVAQIGLQRFVGPDNGIFTPMLQQAEQLGWPVRIVHTHRTAYWLPEVSDRFMGAMYSHLWQRIGPPACRSRPWGMSLMTRCSLHCHAHNPRGRV